MSLIKKAQKQPSYFEGMEIGDELPIITRDNISVRFEKSSNESGIIHLNVSDKINRSFEIEYDFENFPTMRSQFIKRIRYIFLKDFSIPDFQNEDLLDTKLNLVKDLDLGYGISVVKTRMEDVPGILSNMKKMAGDPNADTPTDPSEILPKGTLKDFVYTIYFNKDGKKIPLGCFAIPFESADEIYDLNTFDEIRDFFIDVMESSVHSPIEEFAKSLQEKHGVKELAGAFERLDSGNLDANDLLNFYNETAKNLQPGSREMKNLHQRVENLIRRLHEGESITKNDLKMSASRPEMPKNVEYVKDYRRTIQMTQLEKAIGRVTYLFDQRIKTEKDESKIAEIRSYYFDMKNKISDIKSGMEGVKDISKPISDINVVLQNATDFIKK